MFSLVAYFVMTAVNALVQDHLVEEAMVRKEAARAKKAQGSAQLIGHVQTSGSRSRSRSRSQPTDASFVPLADAQAEAEVEAAPAVGRLVSTRTRSASRTTSRTRKQY
jgi:hypothetical protein